MTIRQMRGQDPLSFTPVPRRIARRDGWNPKRQKQFIAALAATGSVTAAALQVGMAKEGAYALRVAPGGESFARAWDFALGRGIGRLASIAMERAIDGTPVPIMHGGVQVGERRNFDNRLLTFMLRHHRPDEFGANPGLHPGTTGAARSHAAFFAGHKAQEAEGREARRNIRRKLLAARHSYQRSIAGDPARRAAWDLLCGPADWDAVREGRHPRRETPYPMSNPATAIPAANGWLPDLSSDEEARTAEEKITRLLASIAANDPASAAATAADGAPADSADPGLTLEEARDLMIATLAERGIDIRQFDDPEPLPHEAGDGDPDVDDAADPDTDEDEDDADESDDRHSGDAQ